jgi:hypothetical protein
MAAQVGCASSDRPTARATATLVGTVQAGKKAGVQGIQVIRSGVQVSARQNMLLEAGDELRTNAVSQAVILFADGSWVIAEPNTVVRISSLTVAVGKILVRAKRLFQVETEFVKVAVEGTAYEVAVDENNQTSVSVAEGKTRLTSNTGSWGAVAVLERERASLKGREIPQKQPLSPAEVVRILQQLRTFETFFIRGIIDSATPGLGPGLR